MLNLLGHNHLLTGVLGMQHFLANSSSKSHAAAGASSSAVNPFPDGASAHLKSGGSYRKSTEASWTYERSIVMPQV